MGIFYKRILFLLSFVLSCHAASYEQDQFAQPAHVLVLIPKELRNQLLLDLPTYYIPRCLNVSSNHPIDDVRLGFVIYAGIIQCDFSIFSRVLSFSSICRGTRETYLSNDSIFGLCIKIAHDHLLSACSNYKELCDKIERQRRICENRPKNRPCILQ